MNDEVLVSVQNVSKKFCRDLKTSLWYGVKDLTSEFFGRSKDGELRPKEFYAVNDVSFELRRGECLGLIGHNGAGKSTLLKMLNGLIKPDKGSITMKGRIGALIELGAGFNPLLTGRENIYINGQVLGFTRKEIDEKFDAIVDFAEIGEFIDAPVQNYSSGMKVRLGFAVAAQMEPDVLLIDEVLAVGDIGFRLKCLNKIGELIIKSSVIFVSHSMPQISRTCTSCILMNKGMIASENYNVANAISHYYNMFDGEKERITGKDIIKINSLEVYTDGVLCTNGYVKQGKKFSIKIHIKFLKKIDDFIIKIYFVNNDMRTVLDIPSELTNNSFKFKKEECIIKMEIHQLFLNVGKYDILLVIQDSTTGNRLYRHDSLTSINIVSDYISWSDTIQPAIWQID